MGPEIAGIPEGRGGAGRGETGPALEEIEGLISRNPDVARYVKELEQRSAALEVQKVKSIPDITLSGGMQRFNENDENAFVLGITIPLRIFDRNQGWFAIKVEPEISRPRAEGV